MQIAFLLLFISLIGMITIVGKKMEFVKKRNVTLLEGENSSPLLFDVKRLEDIFMRSVKKYGYAILFIVLRLYIRYANLLKRKSLELAKKIEDRLKKSKFLPGTEVKTEKEYRVNKYLKMISEYQVKIRKMREKIREEERVE